MSAAASGSHINIVVIGDSYSAGNGAGGYYGPHDCYRSKDNWSERYAQWLRTQGHSVTVNDRACSGGVTSQYWNPRDLGDSREYLACHTPTGDEVVTTTIARVDPGGSVECNTALRAQRDAVDQSTDLVLFTFGGNDLHFSDLVKQCFIIGLRNAGDCRAKVNAAISMMDDAKSDNVQTRIEQILIDLYTNRLRKDAKVVLLGYPQLIGPVDYVLRSHDYLHRVTDTYDAAKHVRALGARGVDVQTDAVRRAETAVGADFVTYLPQALSLFDGHQPNPRVGRGNGGTWLVEPFNTISRDTWYHPNPDGHEQYANILETNFGDGAARSPIATAQSLDLVFVIDTTGSMGGTIDTVKQNVTAVVDQLAAGTSSYRIAVVSYRDQPDYTGDPVDYPSRLDQGFTTDIDAVKAAIGNLEADGGGDYPESAYSGLDTAIKLPWRSGVKKEIVLFTDAPAHDPEPVSNLTASNIIDAALAVDPAVVNVVGNVDAELASVAAGTGGQALDAFSDVEIADALNNIVSTSLAAPFATIGDSYNAAVGVPVAFSAAGSFDPAAGTLTYSWDVNSDGTVDATTTAPSYTYTYPAAYRGLVSMEVTASNGRSSTATAPILVDNDGDGVQDEVDNCAATFNPGQEDQDSDQIGDLCDATSGIPTTDMDGVEVVGSINQPPTATADKFAVAAGTTLKVPAPGVLRNDNDPDGDRLTTAVATKPAHGTLALAADGSFTYTPARGYSGTDSFAYVALDTQQAKSTPAKVTLTVTPRKAKQQILFVVSDRHHTTISGVVTGGRLVTTRTKGVVRSITGTVTVKTRSGHSVRVTVNVKRVGRGYKAVLTVKDGKKIHTYRGKGTVTSRNTSTTGTFRAAKPRFRFVITTRYM
ncbi:hypothetical protein KRM28CT15_42930 [Krasilnikovia sp. M28-CT-15]